MSKYLSSTPEPVRDHAGTDKTVPYREFPGQTYRPGKKKIRVPFPGFQWFRVQEPPLTIVHGTHQYHDGNTLKRVLASSSVHLLLFVLDLQLNDPHMLT